MRQLPHDGAPALRCNGDMKTISANGIDIAYTEVGDGPPLVLLHGALVSTSPAWIGSHAAHVDHLATFGKHFRVIAPDTRGSGATVFDGPAPFDVLVDDVVALIGALGLDRPLIAGFSEGAMTATLVTLRHPELVRGLVNHAGFDYFDPNAPAHQGLGMIFGGRPDATAGDPDAADRAFHEMMGPDEAKLFDTMKADYADWRGYIGQFFDRSAAPAAYGVGDLASITAPTLVLTGDRDMFCSVELACSVYRTIAGSELAIVPNTGHEINANVIDAMVDFLVRVA